jgi:hypothetical protein
MGFACNLDNAIGLVPGDVERRLPFQARGFGCRAGLERLSRSECAASP